MSALGRKQDEQESNTDNFLSEYLSKQKWKDDIGRFGKAEMDENESESEYEKEEEELEEVRFRTNL
jgi:hypothetical protein